MADLSAVYTKAMERWQNVWSYEQDLRDQAQEAIKFAQIPGNQWEDSARERRKDRPQYEINKIALSVAQVVGDQRQNQISMKVRPSGGGATDKVANTFNGLIRNIENNSKFKNCLDGAFSEVCNGGVGAWQIVTKSNEDDFFNEQDIRIEPIRSAVSSVFFDPSSTAECNEDARFCFVLSSMSKDAFKEKYPKATITDFDTAVRDGNCPSDWIDGDAVRVADYWVKERVKVTIALLSDKRVIELTKDVEKVTDELAQKGVTIVQTKEVTKDKVLHYKMSGAEIVEGPKEWAGRHIPVIMVYGFTTWVDGKRHWRGMVKLAMDAQRVYNYTSSARIEATALSVKDPYWATKENAKGLQREFQTLNTVNKPVRFYNPDPATGGQPPQRTGAPAVQTALIEQMQQADQDIQATTGRFAPSLGDNPQQQSGRAILAQQKQGDIGTFELPSNLVKGVEYTAVQLIGLVPVIFDTPRQIRVVKEDGETEMVMVNSTETDQQTGKDVIINDLSLGEYDVVSSVGPSYSTKRTEAVNALSQLAANSPMFAQVSADLIAKNLDFPFAEELTGRIRKHGIAQGWIDASDEEQQEAAQNVNQQEQQLQKMLQDAQNALAVGQADKLELENEKLRMENMKLQAQVISELAKGDKTRADAEKVISETGGESQANATIGQATDIASINTASQLNEAIVQPDVENQQIQQPQQQQAAPQIDAGSINPDAINNLT